MLPLKGAIRGRYILAAALLAASCARDPAEELGAKERDGGRAEPDASVPSEPDAGVAATVDEYCTALFEAYARKLPECIGGTTEYWRKYWEQSGQLHICRLAEAQVASGARTFNAGQAQSCIENMDKIFCEGLWANLPDICDNIYVRNLQEGEICKGINAPCAEGLVCDNRTYYHFDQYAGYSVLGACTKKCVRPFGSVPEGGPCTGAGFECAEGLVCDKYNLPSKCRTIPGDGQPCVTTCAPGLFCESTASLCRPVIARGELCDANSFDRQCGEDACRPADDGVSRCTVAAKLGERCESWAECARDICVNNVCTPYSLAGERCGEESGNVCNFGFCPEDEGICPELTIDGPCTDLRDCLHGDCIEGACVFYSSYLCD